MAHPSTQWKKLICGGYIILEDYSVGELPPRYEDSQQTFRAEIDYRSSRVGVDEQKAFEAGMRKPFWEGEYGASFLRKFANAADYMQSIGIQPGQSLLELGCGAGWMAELFPLLKYDVTATTISLFDVCDAQRRVTSVEAKGLSCNLRHVASPMEEVDDHVMEYAPFNGVHVFEALHHAHDWRQALRAAHHCLCDGGWIFILCEPNVAHTSIAYWIAKLSNTYEIGFLRSDLVGTLGDTGFKNVRVLKNRLHWCVKPHWIMAQKKP